MNEILQNNDAASCRTVYCFQRYQICGGSCNSLKDYGYKRNACTDFAMLNTQFDALKS